MSFLHPWLMVAGGVAATAPVLIHWLTRPRPTRKPLSTLRFVLEAVRQRRAVHRLRDLVVLTLRTVAILLLAAALARPQFGPQPLVSDRLAGDAVRVVLLDASQSMAATQGGIQAMERARSLAAGYLRYRAGLAADLIVAGATPQAVFEGPSTNFEALREALVNCRPRAERLDVRRALTLAGRLLAPVSPEDQRRRELVVLSDFQRSNWQQADFSALPEKTQIQLEAVGGGESAGNLGIVHAECRTAAGGAQHGELIVEVGNYSPSPRKVAVEVMLGEAVHTLEGFCPAGRRTRLSEGIELRQAGWQTGQARLVGVEDALAADNTCPLVARVRPKPVYALITREGAAQRPSSSHYLECALVPDARQAAEPSGQVVRLAPQAMDRQGLASSEVIVLDHPGPLPPEAIDLLAGLLRRGRPILYAAAETADAVNLRRLGQAAGSGLRMPVEFRPPDESQRRRELFLTAARAEEAPFAVFGDQLPTLLGRLRFAGGLASRNLPGAVADDVLARYHDGSAALTLTAADAGVLAVLNADLGTSNLPKMPIFVPMIQELLGRMIERGAGLAAVVCGESLVVSLPGDAGPAGGLAIEGPAGTAEPCGELIEEPGGVVWRWANPNRLGTYRIRRGMETVFALPIAVPAEESDLAPIAPEVLQKRLAGGRDVGYHTASGLQERRDEDWTWFLAAAVACLLGELSALLIFRM